nr:immunoglobulin light chain junction region [Macaca mulatta]
CHQYNSYLRTF